LSHLALEEVGGFMDLLLEFVVVGEVQVNFLEGEVDEHTSDLGGKVLSSELSDVVEDDVSDVLLEMGVVSLDGGDNVLGLVVEGGGGGVLRLSELHGGSLLVGKLNGVLLGHGGSGALVSSLSVLLHLVLVAHVVVSHGASGVVALGSSVTTLLVVVVSVATLGSVVSLLVTSLTSVELLGEAGVALHLSENLGDLEVELVSGGDVLPVVVLVVELLELLEAELILGLFVLDLSELLELVMADLELSLSVESVVQELDGVLGLVGGLEANKSVGLLGGLNGEHLDGLDFTVFLEDLLEVLVVELGVKVLDVEVASLLGVLVLDGLTDELGLSLGSSEGGLDVKEFTVTHVSTVEGIDGFESFLGSVLVVVLVLRHVADKGESLLDLDSAFLVLAVHLDEGSNVTEGSEKGLELLIREGLGVVLNVEVVEHTSGVVFVLGVPLDGDAVSVGGRLLHHVAGLGGILGGLVAYETVASGRVVLVEGDLEGLDGVLGVGLEGAHLNIELGGSHVLGDLADEDVAVSVGLGQVGSEEGVIESKSSAGLTGDGEVSQEFSGLLVHFFVLDSHDTGVERLGGVSADLRLVVNLDTSVLEKSGKRGGSEFGLGEIVKVDQVLVLSLHFYCFFGVFAY